MIIGKQGMTGVKTAKVVVSNPYPLPIGFPQPVARWLSSNPANVVDPVTGRVSFIQDVTGNGHDAVQPVATEQMKKTANRISFHSGKMTFSPIPAVAGIGDAAQFSTSLIILAWVGGINDYSVGLLAQPTLTIPQWRLGASINKFNFAGSLQIMQGVSGIYVPNPLSDSEMSAQTILTEPASQTHSFFVLQYGEVSGQLAFSSAIPLAGGIAMAGRRYITSPLIGTGGLAIAPSEFGRHADYPYYYGRELPSDDVADLLVFNQNVSDQQILDYYNATKGNYGL